MIEDKNKNSEEEEDNESCRTQWDSEQEDSEKESSANNDELSDNKSRGLGELVEEKDVEKDKALTLAEDLLAGIELTKLAGVRGTDVKKAGGPSNSPTTEQAKKLKKLANEKFMEKQQLKGNPVTPNNKDGGKK